MGNLTICWSEDDPADYWVEILPSWISEEFRCRLQFNKGRLGDMSGVAIGAADDDRVEWADYYYPGDEEVQYVMWSQEPQGNAIQLTWPLASPTNELFKGNWMGLEGT